MGLKLSKTQTTVNGLIVNSYKIGNYAIIEYIRDGFTVIYTRPNMEANDFLPDIYAEDKNEDGNITEFKIQTTSYGALSSEDTKRFIEAYEEALEVVEILTDKFVNKDK